MSIPKADASSLPPSDPAVLVYINVADLNRLWAERYASCSHELNLSVPVISEREMNQHTWELSVVRLGYPNLQFDTSRHRLTVSRRVLTDLRVYMTPSNGTSVRQAIRIEQSAADSGKVLQVTLELQDLHMEYHTTVGRGVYVHWSKPAVYEVEQDPLSADRFRQHFERLKQMKLTTLSAPLALALHHIWIYYDDYDDLQVRPVLDSYIRYDRTRQKAHLSPMSETATALLGFNINTFPLTVDQVPPVGKNWVVGLFAPSGSLQWQTGGYIPGGQHYLSGYKSTSPTSASAQIQSATHVCDLPVTPLVTFSDVGGEPIEFESLSSVNGVTWRAQESLYGMLRSRGGKCCYTPPAALSPAVQFNQAGDTLVPAAYRNSLSTPTITEVVRASAEGRVGYVSIVVRRAHPTHFIRVAKHASELKLSLCYIDRNYQENVVPDAQVSWHVVAGNGSVSSGVFKPAESDPSAYAVVIGIDESRQDEWRWGMTIIALPMLDIDTLVEAYSP